jgi:hypothetical protein
MRAINRGGTAFQRSLGDETGGMDPMETEPKRSYRKVFTGLVERVTYQNADNAFASSGSRRGVTESWSPSLAMPP